MRALCAAVLMMVNAWLCLPSVAQDYYPLQVGNAWFYRSISQAPGDSTIFSSFRVIGDSLFSNGRRYLVLDSVDIMEAHFLRIDSGSVCYLDPADGQDQRVFNLNARVGDTMSIRLGPYFTIQLISIDTIEVLGHADRVLTYRVDGLVSPSIRRLSKRFGPLYEERYSDGWPPWPYYGRNLVGCTIGGLDYGLTVGVVPGLGSVRAFELLQNFPNPFNPGTRIAFSVGVTSDVSLGVSDILGRHVRWLRREVMPAGLHSAWWDGLDDHGMQLSSGAYFVVLRAGEGRYVRRMNLLR